MTSTQEPKPEDYGITPEDYALYTGTREWRYSFLIFIFVFIIVISVVASIVFVITRDMAVTVWLGIISAVMPVGVAAAGVTWLAESAIVRFKRSQLAPRIKLYEEARFAYEEAQREAYRARREAERAREEALREAERARQEAERVRLEEERALEEARREVLRKREEYWSGLSGLEFERELGSLCERRGYEVSFTPTSGDGGADLILRKKGKTTVVQCKRHKSPASPAVVRELYGTMVHLGADRAILACTGGFTKGVRDFANGKPIILVSALELARMSEVIEGNRETGG